MNSSDFRYPHLLRPYLSLPPESSLILLTSVINASTNWLVSHLIQSTLLGSSLSSSDLGHTGSSSIVFLSFLRDWDFWREGARRNGCDLLKHAKDGRFVFLDGLTSQELLSSQPLALEEVVLDAIQRATLKLPNGRVILVLDGLDFYLAAHVNKTTEQMLDVLASWREQTYSVIITASIDSPLIQSPSTPLELNHAAFITSTAHQASIVMSLRLLSTGAAKDVSGELRITGGAHSKQGQEISEKELLYLVNGDGSVRVFERGSGG